MPSPRQWNAVQLVAAWIVAAICVGLLHRLLGLGVYRLAVEGYRVTQVAGHWPDGFVTLVTVVVAGGLTLVLSWLTSEWFSGRRERELLRGRALRSQRSILM